MGLTELIIWQGNCTTPLPSNLEAMKTKEFIEQVITGEQGIFDVLDYASHVKRDYNGDIQALADDLFHLFSIFAFSI